METDVLGINFWFLFAFALSPFFLRAFPDRMAIIELYRILSLFLDCLELYEKISCFQH